MRLYAGIVLMFFATFGQLAIYGTCAVHALINNQLGWVLIWGVIGPIVVLVSGPMLARPIAYLVTHIADPSSRKADQ